MKKILMIIAAVMMTGTVNANNDSTAVNRKKVAVVLSDRRKQNTYLYSTGLTIGKQDKQGGGIIKGKNLAELFQQLCVGFTDSLDFSRNLRIPFACVATNINLGYEF